jgi:hypothetical protein
VTRRENLLSTVSVLGGAYGPDAGGFVALMNDRQAGQHDPIMMGKVTIGARIGCAFRPSFAPAWK